MALGKKREEKYQKAKEKSSKAADKDQKAQEDLRNRQNVNNPPPLTRRERELAKRMDEEPNPPKKPKE